MSKVLEFEVKFGRCVRYFFNATSKSCEPFSYNGCSGSGNRFTTLSDCRDICETTASSRSSSSSSKASAAAGGSSAGLVAAEAVVGTAVVLLAIAAVVLGARYARTAGMCPAWCGSYKRFFGVGGGIGGIGGILRRDRAGSTSSRRESNVQRSNVNTDYRGTRIMI